MTAPKRIWAIANHMEQKPSWWLYVRETPKGPEYQRESGDKAVVALSELKVLTELKEA